MEWNQARVSEDTIMNSCIKNLPAMQETQESGVRSLGGEDPLEERKAAHSWRILAWRIPPVPRVARDAESHLK